LATAKTITGNNYFIGKAGAATDEFCTSKVIASLGDAYGLCPEGPTLQGSFHMAGLAHYARTHDLRTELAGVQDVRPSASRWRRRRRPSSCPWVP
jgi:type IV pilus assembly protein PilY1